MQLRVLDLFSGIGGFSLGLERTGGFQTMAFCEIDSYCRAVLARHWPGVPCFPDVTKLCRRAFDCEPETEDGEVWCPRCSTEFGECDCVGADEFIDEHGRPDVVTGGFPCQDISLGHTWRAAEGISGKRSGLWWEMLRVIEQTEPSWVIAENVSALRSRGLDAVLWSLAEVGYDAEWYCLPASAFGADHQRDRVWIIAYPASKRVEGVRPARLQITRALEFPFLPLRDSHGQWQVEPDLRRANDGLPGWMDRLRCVGNAVCPQIPEAIGRAILAAS